jgi:hypothetical protein
MLLKALNRKHRSPALAVLVAALIASFEPGLSMAAAAATGNELWI